MFQVTAGHYLVQRLGHALFFGTKFAKDLGQLAQRIEQLSFGRRLRRDGGSGCLFR